MTYFDIKGLLMIQREIGDTLGNTQVEKLYCWINHFVKKNILTLKALALNGSRSYSMDLAVHDLRSYSNPAVHDSKSYSNPIFHDSKSCLNLPQHLK